MLGDAGDDIDNFAGQRARWSCVRAPPRGQNRHINSVSFEAQPAVGKLVGGRFLMYHLWGWCRRFHRKTKRGLSK